MKYDKYNGTLCKAIWNIETVIYIRQDDFWKFKLFYILEKLYVLENCTGTNTPKFW